MSKVKDFIISQIAKHSGLLPEETRRAFSPDQQVELDLTGPNGGVYHLRWEDAELKVHEGKAPTPLVAMSSVAREFLDMMTGKLSPDLDVTKLEDMSHFKLNPITMLAPQKIEHIQKLKGTFHMKICEGSVPREDDILSETFMAFNGEVIQRESPRCVVIMPIVSMERIATGKISPPQVFMAGGMRAIGDISFLMQMAPLLA